MASNDEWWRHDEKDALSPSRRTSANAASQGASQAQSQRTNQNATTGATSSAAQGSSNSYAPSYTSRTSGSQDSYSLSGDTVAPWRKNDATSHLNAMRTKRNTRVRERNGSSSRRSSQNRDHFEPSTPDARYSQFKASPQEQGVPQFKDTTARHGGWNIPSLNSGSTKSNTGTNANLFGGSRLSNIDRGTIITIGALVLALILVIVIIRGLIGCVSSVFAPAPEEAVTTEAAATVAAVTNSAGTADGVSYTVLDENRTTASGMGRLSFSAVGDNLMNENLLELADSWAGESGDGTYDFSPFYTEVAQYVQNKVDVSFINQETTLGGTDNFDYAGYPSYNTPDSLADAVANAGWRVVNLNSNHTYDTWTDSITHNLGVWSQKTSLVTVGSFSSEEERQVVRMVECNGIRVAFLSYSYGQNGYEQSDLPNTYYAVPYDEETLKSDVARARKVADAVVVYMHEGTEYTNDANDEQKAIAQVCADNGVDVVIGSHSHVIQPVEWINRSDGTGQMLCVYGLGDFVSGYTNYPDVVLSGMITFDFVRVNQSTADDAVTEGDTGADAEASTDSAATTAAANVGPGGVAVENVVWHPLIEHMEGSSDVVRFVKGYTDEEARANELLTTLDDPLAWLKEKTQEVIGDAVTIDM